MNSIYLNFFWKLSERSGAQFINFFVTILLTRILTPEDFGTIAILFMINAVAMVFIQSGLGTSLIRSREVTKNDLNSVFWFNIISVFVIYFILFVIANPIEIFFNLPNLKDYIRVSSLSLFPFALNVIQNVVVVRNMQFRKVFKVGILVSILSSFGTLILAYLGAGVWAIVFQQISTSILTAAFYYKIINWRPELFLSIKLLANHFAFGWKNLLTSFLNVIYNESSIFFIGKKYSAESLGYFSRGRQIPLLVTSNLDNSIQSVMLPVYSKLQDEPSKLLKQIRQIMKLNSIFFLLIVGILYVNVDNIIILVFTDKWIDSVIFFKIFLLHYSFQPFLTTSTQALNSIGKSNTILLIEVLRKGIGVILIIYFASKENITLVAISYVVYSLVAILINLYPNFKYFRYKPIDQLKDIFMFYVVNSMIVYLIEFMKIQNTFGDISLVVTIFVNSLLYLFTYVLILYLFFPVFFKLHLKKMKRE